MNDRSKEAGTLIPGDQIDVKHHKHDGPPCTGEWCVECVVVDQTDKASVELDGRAVVGWHDPDRPALCGVLVLDAHDKVPFHGHVQAAA